MADNQVINPTEPFQMPDPQAVANWRHGNPQAPDYSQPALAPQSPLANEAFALPPEPPRPPATPQLNIPQHPAYPTQQKIGPPPDARDYQKNSMQWASAMAIIGALAGRITRASGGAALGAFASALDGWRSGNLEAYENASKKWEQANRATLENNRQELEKYRAILEDNRLTIDEQMTQLQVAAIGYKDDMMYNAAKEHRLDMVGRIYDRRWEYTYGDKGLQAVTGPLETARAKIEADQALLGARLSSGEIDPTRDLNSKTGQPYTPAEQLQLKGVKERYEMGFYGLPGGQRGGIGGVTGVRMSARNQIIQDLRRDLNREPTLDEITAEEVKRSAAIAGATAESRTLGARAGGIALSVDEAHETIPKLLTLAEKSAGRGSAIWSKIEAQWKVASGDENFAEYVSVMNALINTFGGVMARGGQSRVTDKEHARETLNPNMPLSAVRGSLRGFETELDIAESAPERVRAKMRDKQRGGSAAPSKTTIAPILIQSPEESHKLAPGTHYVTPDGQEYIR